MLIELMFLEISKLIASIITLIAFERFFTCMDHFMDFEVFVCFECFITIFALERSLIAVIAHVSCQTGGCSKRFFTF